MSRNPTFKPVKDQIRSKADTVPVSLSFPEKEANYGMLMIFREYQYRTSQDRGFAQLESAGSRTTDTIFLPLPNNIQDQLGVRVQRFEQGSYGDLVSNSLSEIDINDLGINSIVSSITSGVLKNIPDFGGSDVGNISRDLAFLTRKGIDSQFPNQGRNIDAGTGTTINPKAALAFEGVEMKSLTFDWTLAPKSARESDIIRDITNVIKKNMLPSYVNTSVIQRAMFKYPAMVDMFFVGIDPGYYYYFKTAMIQNYTVNYSPNGNAVMKGGKPAMVQLSLSMIESDIHTSEDYGGSSTSVTTTGGVPPEVTPGSVG